MALHTEGTNTLQQPADIEIANFLTIHSDVIHGDVQSNVLKAIKNQKTRLALEWVIQDTLEWTNPSPERRYKHQPSVWGPGIYYPQASQIFTAQKDIEGNFTRQLLAKVRDTVAESLMQDNPGISLKPYDREYGPRIIDDPRDRDHEGYIFTDKQGDVYGIEICWVN